MASRFWAGVVATCVGLVLALLLSAGAAIASITVGPNGEKVKTFFDLTSRTGSFYQSSKVASNLTVNFEIGAPYTSPQQDILPVKQMTFDMPSDITFHPASTLPVCPNSKVGPDIDLSIPPKTVIARCPGSVIGNGTAQIYQSHKNLSTGPQLRDIIIVIFHGGYAPSGPHQGRPRLKFYSFTKGMNAGWYMGSVIQQSGTITIPVPVLWWDSGLARFEFKIPSRETPIVYNGSPVAGSVGQDVNYVRAQCSERFWSMPARFLLGYRLDDGSPWGSTYEMLPSNFIGGPAFLRGCVATPGSP